MQTSEQINEIAAACAKAQAALKPAIKDATNPAFRSKYADLASIVEAAKVYAANGVAVWQDVTREDGGIGVRTRLAHTSGQWIEVGPLVVPLTKVDAHGVGSATTYAKRYALSSALGIAADEDDDGNAAVQQTKDEPADPGYTDWLTDLDAVTAEGADALIAAVKASTPARRERLRKDTKTWNALKAKADKVAA